MNCVELAFQQNHITEMEPVQYIFDQRILHCQTNPRRYFRRLSSVWKIRSYSRGRIAIAED
jgi:hypothetical protein